MQKSVSEEYLAEARAIEAFVYYNMAMLWGNIPVVKFVDPNNYDVQSSQSKAEDVYRYCLELLKKCPSVQSLDNGHVTNSFVNILYTELYLSLGQKDLAYSHLKKVLSFNESIFTLNVVDINKTRSTIDIYTQKYVELLKEEIEGKDNSNVWFDRGAIYGTWAALKRLGKAQSLTGIKDYELLLPIPQPEIDIYFPHIKQNPGY
jgi:tetratricopeptide (TPR) repeat protein